MTTASIVTRRIPQRRFAAGIGAPGLIALALIALLLVCAVAAPLIAPANPAAISDDVLAGPSARHLWGTDELGRDVLSGVIFGSRISLLVGLSAAVASTAIGAAVGAYAGFRGGVLDNVVMRIAEMFQVFPTMILAALMVTMFGASLANVVIVIVLLSWPQTARLARTEALRLREIDYVLAARALGHGRARVLFHELIPNLMAPLIALGTLVVAEAILLESSLSFLGLSPQGDVSWGRMLRDGWESIFSAWWLSVFPGVAIFLTILAFNVLGDAMSHKRRGVHR